MIQGGSGCHLAKKPLPFLTRGQGTREDQLYRSLASQPLMPGTVNHAHAAASEFLQQDVATHIQDRGIRIHEITEQIRAEACCASRSRHSRGEGRAAVGAVSWV